MLRRPIAALVANRLSLRAWTALDMLVRGTGRMEEWSDMADACNLVEALVEMVHCPFSIVHCPFSILHYLNSYINLFLIEP